MRNSPATCGHSSLFHTSRVVKFAERSRGTFHRLVLPSACARARATLITANAINQPCEQDHEAARTVLKIGRHDRICRFSRCTYTHARAHTSRPTFALLVAGCEFPLARDSDLFYASPVQRSEAIIAEGRIERGPEGLHSRARVRARARELERVAGVPTERGKEVRRGPVALFTSALVPLATGHCGGGSPWVSFFCVKI